VEGVVIPPVSRRERVAMVALAMALTAALGTARADGGPIGFTPRRALHRRHVPNYDGRGPAPATTTDGLLAIPRAVLFPLRIAFDYGIRRPIGAAIAGAESSHGLRKAFHWLFLRPKTPTPMIFPVAMYDFGFKPSVGARVLWTDGFLTPGSRLSVKLGTGGHQTWRTDVAVKVGLGPAYIAAAAGARERPDLVFYGVGADTPSTARARYRERRLDASVRAGAVLAGAGEASVYGAIAQHRFDASSYAGDPSIEDAVASGAIAAVPAGYADDYTAVKTGAAIALDTRGRGARRTTSGARLDASIERSFELGDTSKSWTRIDATLGASLLLDPVGERKLDVKLRVEHVSAAMATDVPFTELPTASGLRGFAGGRLRGDSAVAMIAEYDWPIAAWLDAHAHAGVGNVFGRDFSGVSAGALRGSAGLGLSIAGMPSERQVRLQAAVGTEPFDHGLDVSSFRLVLGFANDY
jgi:hypothetical protein